MKLLLFISCWMVQYAGAVQKSPLQMSQISADQQAAACQHPGGPNGIDPGCWDYLNMTVYTQSWWSANSATCGPDTPFSECFWQMHNLGTRDCTGIRPQSCPVPDVNGFSAQDWYIAYNIYAINQVFNSYWTAVGNANTLASEQVAAIIALLDPPKKTGTFLNDLLTALSVGLFLIPSATHVLQDTILRLAQSQPTVGKYLYPVGTTESQFSQFAQISNDLSSVVQWYQGNVSAVIPAIVNDVNIFLPFASSGAFSVAHLPDLSTMSQSLLKGLTTFVISQCLKLNNIFIGRSPDTDVNQLQINASDSLAYDLGCGKGYDGDGVCNQWWYDNNTHVSYSLVSKTDIFKDFHPILETMFGNWTTGDLLFAGAARCASKGEYQNGQLATVVLQNGTVDVDCLSSLQLCTWNLASLDSDKEFYDCPSQTDYVSRGCSGGNCGGWDMGSGFEVSVPRSYLGSYLENGNPSDCVCNH